MAKKIKVTQVRSGIGHPARTRKVLLGLGLRKMHGSKVLEDTLAIRGMVEKVQHLVRVESAD